MRGESKTCTLYILEATSDVSQELQARLAFALWKSFVRHHSAIYRTLEYPMCIYHCIRMYDFKCWVLQFLFKIIFYICIYDFGAQTLL